MLWYAILYLMNCSERLTNNYSWGLSLLCWRYCILKLATVFGASYFVFITVFREPDDCVLQ